MALPLTPFPASETLSIMEDDSTVKHGRDSEANRIAVGENTNNGADNCIIIVPNNYYKEIGGLLYRCSRNLI